MTLKRKFIVKKVVKINEITIFFSLVATKSIWETFNIVNERLLEKEVNALRKNI